MTSPSRWRRIAFPILALAAVLLLASTLAEVINPVLVAVLLAVILNPVVNAAARFRMPRVATVALLYLLLGVAVVIFSAVLGRQFHQLGRALSGEPFYEDANNNGLIELAGRPLGLDGVVVEQNEFDDLNGNGRYDPGLLLEMKNGIARIMIAGAGGVWGEMLDTLGGQIVELVGTIARPAGDMISQGLEQVAQWAGGMIQALTLLVLIPFYLFFFLVQYPVMARRLRDLVPPRFREQVDRITLDVGRELVAFLRGRLMCGFVKAILLWASMFALGIQFAVPIALVAGLLSIVPLLGFIAGVVPASVIALTMPGGGTETALWVVGVFVAGEALEGAVLYPLVLGKETGLHPVTLIVVLLAGGALMGTLGVLVAIPIALVIKVLWRELGVPLYHAWAYAPGDDDEAAASSAGTGC